MRTIEWEIKVSKLCNLRCAYCYEFDELDDKRRISPEGWRAILESTRWYQEEIERRFPGQEIKTRYVWHGGEPLLLPLSYYREVLQLQRDILGAENVGTRYSNHVPTNLYAVPPETLKFLKEERFQIAVSFDAIAGVRVLGSGAATEGRVLDNLRGLLADGWRVGCNVVLAAHTAPHLNNVYDSIRDTVRDSNGGLYLNIIPLHGTPTDDGAAPFSIGAEQIVDALHNVFEHWLEDPRAIQLTPVQDYYLNIVRKLFNSPRSYFDRRSYGESSLIINTDGHVYLFREAYERDKSLGCLFEQTFEEITKSRAYAESLDRQDALAARCCGGCPYDGFCNREPLFNGPRAESGERCQIGYPLHQRIERTLAARGFTPEVVRSNLTSLPQAHFITRQSQSAAAGD